MGVCPTPQKILSVFLSFFAKKLLTLLHPESRVKGVLRGTKPYSSDRFCGVNTREPFPSEWSKPLGDPANTAENAEWFKVIWLKRLLYGSDFADLN